MPKRVVKPRRNADFEYSLPTVRRTTLFNPAPELETNHQEQAESPRQNGSERDHVLRESPRDVRAQPSPNPSSTPPQIAPVHHQVEQAIPTSEDDTLDSLLKKIYTKTNSPTAFSAGIEKFLRTQKSLSLHKQRRKHFRRRPFIFHAPYESIMADLIFYTDIAPQNSYYKYALTVIDCFSKMAFVEPLKTKQSEEVSNALERIINRFPIIPRRFLSDAGGEFSGTSPSMHNLLVTKYKMVIYVLTGKMKGSIIERFNRTLKTRIARYMTENNTKRWVDIINEICSDYNHSYHRAIKMRPVDVSYKNKSTVFKNLYPNRNQKVRCPIKPNYKVRIALDKQLFDKGYQQNWSTEIFTVVNNYQVYENRGFVYLIFFSVTRCLLLQHQGFSWLPAKEKTLRF